MTILHFSSYLTWHTFVIFKLLKIIFHFRCNIAHPDRLHKGFGPFSWFVSLKSKKKSKIYQILVGGLGDPQKAVSSLSYAQTVDDPVLCSFVTHPVLGVLEDVDGLRDTLAAIPRGTIEDAQGKVLVHVGEGVCRRAGSSSIHQVNEGALFACETDTLVPENTKNTSWNWGVPAGSTNSRSFFLSSIEPISWVVGQESAKKCDKIFCWRCQLSTNSLQPVQSHSLR